MKIRAGYEIFYDCPQPTPMILTLSVHPSRISDLLTEDRTRLARDRDAHKVLIPDHAARWIKVDPAGAGNVDLDPGMGVAARDTVFVIAAKI